MRSPTSQLWVRIFVPFALGYYLSYLLRTINAVISPSLTAELSLSSADLGFLTSTYFLAFALAQLPLGVMLDRFGPRRVESGLLLVAALGSAAFALSDSLGGLSLARALIGAGVSACLMASLKGFAMWLPVERQTSMTGFIMSAGAVGALTASQPVELILPFLGWRGLFFGVAVLLLIAAALIFWSLPDDHAAQSRETLSEIVHSVKKILFNRHFNAFVGSSMFFTGGLMAMQSLWAMPWLMHVNHLDIADAAANLLLLSLGMLVGQLSIGLWGTRLVRAGVRPIGLLVFGYAAMLTIECAIILDGLPIGLGWFLFGAISSVNAQSYLAASVYFPRLAFGRVSTAINLMAFIGAFAVQWGIGGLLDRWAAAGIAMGQALQYAFWVLVALQLLSWFPLLWVARQQHAILQDHR